MRCNWQMRNRFPCSHIHCMVLPYLSNRRSHVRSERYHNEDSSTDSNRMVQTGTASKKHRRKHKSYANARWNRKYLPKLVPDISMQNGGTDAHIFLLRFPVPQVVYPRHRFPQSHSRSDQTPSGLSDGKQSRS